MRGVVPALIAALAWRGCSRARPQLPGPTDVHRSAAVRPTGGSVFLGAPRDLTLTCPTPRPLSDTEGSKAPTGGETMEQTMRTKMPIDPTMPNPQDPKDPPHSHNRGSGGFLRYVSPGARLSDVLMRVMATGRSKEEAQAAICRAIADRAIKIRAQLGRRTITRNTALHTVLDGNDFQIPTAIDPADLDWEMSRPLEAWVGPTRCL